MDKVKLHRAETIQQINEVRTLLKEYGQLRKLDKALGDFDKELRELPGEYASPDGCLLIANIENKPVGCVAFRKINEKVCEMKRLYVKAEYKGKRVGKALVDQIITESKNTGYEFMRLDTHPWMVQAKEIYRQAGFKEIGTYHSNPTKGIKYFELELSAVAVKVNNDFS
ncbi:GNAT family N-acetyltransferase [Candidatus Amoebophilus asiaticus]|nr:GNAT family N-acetyltransferase [Candidatus Amoebophilus asiaticus]